MILRRVSRQPSILVLVYSDVMTTTPVIRLFLRSVCYVIEVINVCKRWDPDWVLPWEQGAHDEFIEGLT